MPRRATTTEATAAPPLIRFWLALERLPGVAAVERRWRELAGADFDRARGLFVPDARLAGSYPAPGGFGPDYAVVEHGPDDFVAVAEDGDRIVLSRSELIVHRLSLPRLAVTVAAAFGIEPAGSPAVGAAAAYPVGTLRPVAGFAFPVYLTVQPERRDFEAAVAALLAATTGSFVLLAPTNRHHRPASQNLLDARGCLFLALADAIRCGDGITPWELSGEARSALDAFVADHLPPTDRGPDFFPTPAGATWPMVRLRFVDGETVVVRVGDAARTVHYAQMGLADGRNGKPTKQWEFLRTLARTRGVLTWRDKGASQDNQKRKEKLSAALKLFFRIEGEPIRFVPGQGGWQTEFVVEPDT